jgi:hypothetical protein
MKPIEIDKNYFCAAGFYQRRENQETGYCTAVKGSCGKLCSAYHRKYPTPEQFEKKYGEEWNGAVYWRNKNGIKSWGSVY